MLRKLAEEIGAYAEAILMGWPGYAGNRLRTAYLARRLQATDGRFFIDRGCAIIGHGGISIGRTFRMARGGFLAAHGNGRIEIGHDVALNTNVHVNASGGGRIVLGDNVIVGPNTTLRSVDHRFDRLDVPIRQQGHLPREIIVDEDVWLAAHVVVVGGVRIGRGAVIGAGAVVTRSIPEYAIAVGVPARVIGSRVRTPVPT